MMVLLTYDVDFTLGGGEKRLRKVAKICENYGIRVQNSVFELLVDNAQLIKIKSLLLDEINIKTDSVRFYRLGSKWENKIETIGVKNFIQQEGTLIL